MDVAVDDEVGVLVELSVTVDVDVAVRVLVGVAVPEADAEVDTLTDLVALTVQVPPLALLVVVPVAVAVDVRVLVGVAVPESEADVVGEEVVDPVGVNEAVAVAVGVEVEIPVATLPSRISHRYVVLATVVTDTRDRMSSLSAKVAAVFTATL